MNSTVAGYYSVYVTVQEQRFRLTYFINTPSRCFCGKCKRVYISVYLYMYICIILRGINNFVTTKKQICRLFRFHQYLLFFSANQEENSLFFCMTSISGTLISIHSGNAYLYILRKNRDRNFLILKLFRKHQFCSTFKYDS